MKLQKQKKQTYLLKRKQKRRNSLDKQKQAERSACFFCMQSCILRITVKIEVQEE